MTLLDLLRRVAQHRLRLQGLQPPSDVLQRMRAISRLSSGTVFSTTAASIEPVALDLLGKPNKALSSRRELRFGANGSLSVAIAGDGRGQWYSFEDGCGGGVLDLIVRERGGTRAQAMHWLLSQPYAPKNTKTRRRPAEPRRARSGPARPKKHWTTPTHARASRKTRQTGNLAPRPPQRRGTRFKGRPPGRKVKTPKLTKLPQGRPSVRLPVRGRRRRQVGRPPGSGKRTSRPSPTPARCTCPKETPRGVKWTPQGVRRSSSGARRGRSRARRRRCTCAGAASIPLRLMRFDLPGYWPETLRYSTAHPGISLLVAVNDARDGLVCGVQRIFLTPEGRPVMKSEAQPWAKGKDRKLKRSLGDLDGCPQGAHGGNAARFSSWPDPEGRWGLAEGPETALAAEQLWGFPVWAAISSGNMAKIDPPYWAREAFFFVDHDIAGARAASRARERQRANPAIIRTHLVRANTPGDDMADVLNSRSD